MQDGRSVHLVEGSMLKPGICRGKNPKRLKAKHLSEVARREIVRLFEVHQSFDDVAQLMSMPGLTGKTVSEVLHLCQMRKPPASAQSAMPYVVGRRSA